jgi:DnaD/phage-associated family protein
MKRWQMNDKGFIKIYRSLLQWEWYEDINTTRLFIHCLLMANWEDNNWQGLLLKRGSFVTSINRLSKETGLTVQQTRTAINKLKSTCNITSKTTSKYTVISIQNYDKLQENNKQITNEQQTNNTQVNKKITTTKEYKNIRTKEYNIYFFLEESFGRTITSVEMRKLDEWRKWFSDDVIGYAIELTVMRGAKGLSYTEGIINSWHDKGFKNLEQCKNENKEFKVNNEAVKRIQEFEDYDWLNE